VSTFSLQIPGDLSLVIASNPSGTPNSRQTPASRPGKSVAKIADSGDGDARATKKARTAVGSVVTAASRHSGSIPATSDPKKNVDANSRPSTHGGMTSPASGPPAAIDAVTVAPDVLSSQSSSLLSPEERQAFRGIWLAIESKLETARSLILEGSVESRSGLDTIASGQGLVLQGNADIERGNKAIGKGKEMTLQGQTFVEEAKILLSELLQAMNSGGGNRR
jgi:hypothetical protein